jgi:primosomal protein N' (replication factor Y) (superfamily II helicase)
LARQVAQPLLPSLGARVVRVLPDVAAIDKEFDYLVPDQLDGDVRVGTMVRVELHGRRVGGWVVDDHVTPPAGLALRPLAKVSGWGPPPELVDLAGWAARRWAGRRSHFLKVASPVALVRGLPKAAWGVPDVSAFGSDPLAEDALSGGRVVLRLPPAQDLLGVVAAAARRGPTLVVTPTGAAAASLAGRLRAASVPCAVVPRDWAQAAAGAQVVIGSRAAAWAPCPGLAAVVVIDGHDESLQQETAPTWNGRVVAAERARRAGVPCVVVSPCPTVELLAWGRQMAPSRQDERAGWAALEVIDRRRDDPRTGLYSPRLVGLLKSGGRVLCVLNRKGRARLLACAACGELARCTECGAALGAEGSTLVCPRCGATRPMVCASCGSTRLKTLRVGVSRVREELSALVGAPVGEVTGDSTGTALPGTPIVVGTEAVLHRVASADGVAFLDFDQELLAPRFRAGEEALALLALASRLVGGRGRGGRVLVQTRVPHHDVIMAALTADPARLAASELKLRAALGLPPTRALALVSGPAACSYVDGLKAVAGVGVEILGPDGPEGGRWLVRAPDHDALAALLASVARPPGRLRVEVDPLRA